MNVEQHLKIAQWHTEQARLHATSEHSCGCPANEHDQKAIDAIDAMLAGQAAIKEETSCNLNK